MLYADQVGLFNVAAAMHRFAQNPLDDAKFWQPAPLLAKLAAEGKTFKGPEDSYLKIDEARQNDSGQVHLRTTLRAPSMSDDALGMMGGAIFVRRFNGRMAFVGQHESENVAAHNLALQDSKGQVFPLSSAEETTQLNGTEVTQEFRLIFQSRKGLEPPARLVYSGHRLVTVEIPFVLKNVPLKE